MRLLSMIACAFSGFDVPGFMPASPVGYIGSFRTITTSHNALVAWRAGCDTNSINLFIANCILFESQNLEEAYPPEIGRAHV